MEPDEIAQLITEDINFNNGLVLLESEHSVIYVDMDETLLHARKILSKDELLKAKEIVNNKDVFFYKGSSGVFIVAVRPYAREFLSALKKIPHDKIVLHSTNTDAGPIAKAVGLGSYFDAFVGTKDVKPTPNSVLVDNDRPVSNNPKIISVVKKMGHPTGIGSAKIADMKRHLVKQNMPADVDVSFNMVKVPPFTGKRDNALATAAQEVADKIKVLDKKYASWVKAVKGDGEQSPESSLEQTDSDQHNQS